MSIFLDSGDFKEIQRFHKMGIIRGVTTNPTILLKDGVKGDFKVVRKRFIDIAKIIDPYPLSAEVTTNERDEMIAQAKEIASWAKNMVVKIPIHGPNGELDNLQVVHELVKKHGVTINVTAMMSAQQCYLAASAGASFVSLFGGRVNNMGYNTIGEIRILRKLLDDFELPAKIIMGSTREVLNVVEWLHAGAHIVTVLPKFLEGMIVHPYSKETVKMFLDDAEKAKKIDSGK
jgi:transaldolase